MNIGLLTTRFHLPACSSLKEKRQRLSGLRDKFGNTKNIAVCESDFHDQWDQAQYSFLVVANDKKVVESSIAKISQHCATKVDASLADHYIEWL